ncbi:MAG: type II secretion system secretin GspD [Pseudomonadota bacterium]
MTPRPYRPVAPVLLGLLLAATAPAITRAQPSAPVQKTPAPLRAAEPVTLNFSGADIESVARTMATITGRNVVVDPRVKGTMSLNTERPVSPAAAFNQFSAQLRTQGFAVVESAGLYKIVPEADAKLQSAAVTASPRGTGGNQIVTQIFRLSYESANNLVPVLRPLISPNNTINVNPGNNSLVITDYADNLQRMGKIIATLDVANASDVEIIPLKFAIASELVPLAIRLLDSGTASAAGQGQPDTSFRTTLLAEPRGNAIILRAANPARIAQVRALVAKLDRPPEAGASGQGNIHVVYLKNADATQLATTLRAAISGEPGASPPSPAAVPAGASSQGSGGAGNSSAGLVSSANRGAASTGGQIQADAATNSLIITAPEPQYRQLRAVIDKLDARRAQVFVESLIAEVNADKAAEFGIQWQGPLGKNGSGLIGLLGTNFGSGGNNILNLAQSASSGSLGSVVPGAGVNFGVLQRNNGVYALGFLARALEQSGSGNILSTPNLLTLDNEEAKIVIGQNVPFITGQFTNTGSGNNGSVNPFQTIERKDVGLTLRVRPQISENGTVKLVIAQEVSSVQASSVNSPSGLITNKRSIDSTVLVEDGAIVVLGGLLQDEYSDNEEKVPVVGDLPLFGNLFKSRSRGRKKTNLMVFMRPVVVRDAPSTDNLSMDRYELMRGAQQQSQPEPSRLLPINEVPQLPSVPRPAAVAQPPVRPSPQPSVDR